MDELRAQLLNWEAHGYDVVPATELRRAVRGLDALRAERDAAIRRAEAAEADAAKWRRRWEELASAGERHMWCEHGVLP